MMIKGNKIGSGTFGMVYSCVDIETNQEYAFKRNLLEKKTSFMGAIREVDMLRKLLGHPHIVQLEKVVLKNPFIENGVEEGHSPILEKDRQGQRDDSIHFLFKRAIYDLDKFIVKANNKTQTSIDFSVHKKYMVHILLAVEYMHTNKIIHRDLKPSNILIFDDKFDCLNNPSVAQVCDLGLAKPYTYQGIQTPNTVTSVYRAPEIALGYPHYDYKSDIWSLACILFEMIADKRFLVECPDNSRSIVCKILGALPEELPLRKMRSLVTNDKWRKISPLYGYATPKVRKPWIKQLGLTDRGLKCFIKTAGNIDSFCDLLSNMFKFDWDERYSITQCIDHPFFSDFNNLIAITRQQYMPQSPPERVLVVKPSTERAWVCEIVMNIFNNRNKYSWYNHRSLFQALYLFDHYLESMIEMIEMSKMKEGVVEKTIFKDNSDYNLMGIVHTKYETILRFYTCLYSCLKYFATLQSPVTFEEMLGSSLGRKEAKDYYTSEAKLIASNFESAFISISMGYNVYRPSIYEAADLFGDVLEENDIANLLNMYLSVDKNIETTPSKLYQHYVRVSSKDEIVSLKNISPPAKPVKVVIEEKIEEEKREPIESLAPSYILDALAQCPQ